MNIFLTIPLVLPILFFCCSSDDTVNDRNEFANKNSRVSECGGFSSASRTASDPDTSATEKLVWSYDTKTRTLSLLNKRVSLNCCGAHAISAVRDGSDIVIVESDRPLENGRCKCLCLFDFSTEIEGLSEGAVSLRLELTVDSTLFKKWSGSISLDERNGEITIPKAEKTAFSATTMR